MTVSYNVRGGVEQISDDSSTTADLKQAATEVKQLGTVDTSFSRGQLYILDEAVVFVQSINESTVRNLIDNIFSKGPFNPLRTFGLYKPYEAPLEEADQDSGSWRIPYSDIAGISLLSKGSGYEIFLRPAGDPGYLYRIRNDQGTDYIGFRWLYSPNHDTAVQMAGELFDQASRYGRVEQFDAGGHFVGRTKQVEFPQGDSEYANKEPAHQATPSTTEPQDSMETSVHEQSGVDSDSLDWMEDSGTEFQLRNQTDETLKLTVGCRTASSVSFTEETALEPGEEAIWEDLPEEEFQIGITGAINGGRTFEPAEIGDTLTTTVTQGGLQFSETGQTSFSDEAGTPQGNERTPEPESSQTSDTDTNRGEANETSIAQESAETEEGDSDLKLRLFGFGLVVVLLGVPASGIIIGPGFVTGGVLLLGTVLTIVGLLQALLSWIR